MPPFNNPQAGPISMGDVPEAVMNLDRRTTAIEDYLVKSGAPTQLPATGATSPGGNDPRVDDIYAVLEKYFGKELAEASAVRLGPQNTGVAVQAGPVVQPQQTMQRPGLVDTSLAPSTLNAPEPVGPGFTPSAQPAVTVPPDNQFRPG